mgnify:CR=1 FL=1
MATAMAAARATATAMAMATATAMATVMATAIAMAVTTTMAIATATANDIAIAILALHRDGLAKRALVIDLDVHQGDGTAAIFEGDPNVFTFSMHGANNFPFRKQRSFF